MYRSLFPALLAITFSGCGTGSYDQQLRQRVEAVKQTAPFMVLKPEPVLIPGTNFSIRLPKQFATPYDENSPHPGDPGGRIDPQRVQPPFLKLPGFKLCYEATERENNRSMPWYCYIAVDALEPAEIPAFEADLLEQVKNTFPDATIASVDATKPDGATEPWKKIAVKGQQQFKVDGSPASLAATFELWIHEGKAGVVLVAWRAPDAIVDKINFNSLPEVVAGTFTVEAAPPAEQPPAEPQP